MQKLMLATATALTICLHPISNAQEKMNRMDYKTDSSDPPSCHVETEVDLITDEESHRIFCSGMGLTADNELTREYITISATISPNEENSRMDLMIHKPFLTTLESGIEDILVSSCP
ncbi:MAG: hypothetical protein OXI17_09015 [Gammaproteobacteria bacterium]|nr:hypothetical protein [Gammaproteobacteria bacterium]